MAKIKREAQFGMLLRHWLKTVKFKSCALELKQTTKDYLSFSAVKPHQLDALRAAAAPRGNGLLYKIPDDSRGIKPFDFVFLHSAQAFIVIKYPNCFVLIDIWAFLVEIKQSKRKSLTCERAKKISTYTANI